MQRSLFIGEGIYEGRITIELIVQILIMDKIIFCFLLLPAWYLNITPGNDMIYGLRAVQDRELRELFALG